MVGQEAPRAARRVSRFRHFLAIDWSGAAGERQAGIALALCSAAGEAPVLLKPDSHRHWSRQAVLDYLRDGLPADTLVGMDLGISLPFADVGAFFPGWSTSPPDARTLWRLVDETCAADPHLSVTSFVDHPQASAFFRRHGGREGSAFHLPGAAHRRGRFRLPFTNPLPERTSSRASAQRSSAHQPYRPCGGTRDQAGACTSPLPRTHIGLRP